MIVRALDEDAAVDASGLAAAERIARAARSAPSDRGGRRSGAPRCSRRSSHDRQFRPSSPRELDAGGAALRHLQLPGRVRRAGAHAAAASSRASRCCSSTPSHHFAETYAYRDEIAARWELNLINLRAERALAGAVAAEHAACCARHKVEPLFRALAGLRRVVHRAAARSVAEPRQSAGGRAVHAADRQVAAQDQPARAAGRPGTCGPTRKRARHSAAAALRRRATRASAASRARRCRSIRATIGRAAGAARSSNAGSTSRRSEMKVRSGR